MAHIHSLSLYIFCMLFLKGESARILLLPTQFSSHIRDSQHLGVALANRGHEVYTLLNSRVLARYERPEIQTIRFHMPEDIVVSDSDEYADLLLQIVFSEDFWRHSAETSASGMRDCDLILTDTNAMSQIKNMAFDITIYDGFLLAPCLPLISEIAGIPLRVSFIAGLFPWQYRIPALPSFVPTVEFSGPKREGLLGLLQRFSGLCIYAIGMRIFKPTQNVTLLEKFTPKYQSYGELLRRSDLVIVSRDYILEEVGPSMPNVLYTGGLSTGPARKLSEELEDFMGGASEGVILFSFGSSFSKLPEETIKKFVRAFTGLSQRVIWRLSAVPGDIELQLPANIMIMDWLPQNDILGHSKTRLFLTHCGNNGQYEALYHGVPMLGIPLFAEQPKNCYRAEEKGVALSANIVRFTSEELRDKIQILLTNKTYTTNARKLSAIMKDAPMTPTQTAVYAIEHILKFGSAHLRSAAMDMPLYQFLMLDVLAIIYCICLVLSCVMFAAMKCLCRYCSKQTKIGKEKQS